ncbi:MAG: hypothetical protein JWO80_5103 [Bryobacterales bacterium]|nr:hypothetical protein [Bryobacterales bacterium]
MEGAGEGVRGSGGLLGRGGLGVGWLRAANRGDGWGLSFLILNGLFGCGLLRRLRIFVVEIAQEEEVLERAMVHAVEAGFVAVEQVELGAGGELRECRAEAGVLVDFRFCGGGHARLHGAVQEVGFDGPQAAEAAGAGGHFFDGGEFDIVGGFEFCEVLVEERGEGLLGFVFHEDAFGEEAVPEGVRGGTLFAGFGFGASGFGAVGARGDGSLVKRIRC